MHIFRKIFLLLVLFTPGYYQLKIIRDLIQYNLVGIPVLHKDMPWHFDHEIGEKRSLQYQQLNGRYGEKAIERIGLGTDGKHELRLLQQQERDKIHLY